MAVKPLVFITLVAERGDGDAGGSKGCGIGCASGRFWLVWLCVQVAVSWWCWWCQC